MSTKLWLVCNVLPLHASSSRHSLQMFDRTRHTWTASPLKCFQDDVCFPSPNMFIQYPRYRLQKGHTCVCTFQCILWRCKSLHVHDDDHNDDHDDHDDDHDNQDDDHDDKDNTCMCPYVGGEVVWPTELSETDPTLEGLLAWEHWICLFIFSCNLFKIISKFIKNTCVYSTVFRSTCVYPYVSRQFVAPRESPITLIHRTSIRSLVYLDCIGTIKSHSCWSFSKILR